MWKRGLKEIVSSYVMTAEALVRLLVIGRFKVKKSKKIDRNIEIN